MRNILFILLFCMGAFAGSAKNYAILFSAEPANYDDNPLDCEFWYDLYLAYEALISKGYSHDDIYVFYGAGVDFNTKYIRYKKEYNGWANQITDFSNDPLFLRARLAYINQNITSNDNVLFWWVVGHGKNSGNIDKYECLIVDVDDFKCMLSKSQVRDIMSVLSNYNSKAIIWMTCYSGCLVGGNNSLNFDRTAVLTSSQWNVTSKSYPYTEGKFEIRHTELNNYTCSALKGNMPDGSSFNADKNSDNVISFEEMHLSAKENMKGSIPQLGNWCSIANRTFLYNNLTLTNAQITTSSNYNSRVINAGSSTTISNGASVHFVAQDKVILSPGFKVNYGSSMHAYIDNETCSSQLKSVTVYEDTLAEATLSYVVKDFDLNQESLDVPDTKSEISISPNPASNYIKITSTEGMINEITVSNSKSQVMYQSKCRGDEENVDISSFAKGVYFFRISTAKGVTIKKIILK